MKRASILFACLSLGLVGCGAGADGPPMYAVSGLVTFDGQPVEKGRILFRQTDGDRQAFAGEIVQGKYEVKARSGPTTVEIRASRPIPGKFDNSNGTPEPVGEMYIPEKYNSRTELTADIAPTAKNEIPFELTSK